ncbi:MAG: choice-of-anchor A family protein [Lachnospiraceae bacterium]|nr:choice-of-anchor A family protein [Lachnospiraceae bacterium]
MGKAVAAESVTYTIDSSMEHVVDILDAYALIVFGRLQVQGHQHTNTLTNEFYGLEAAERDRFKNEFSIRSYINTAKNPHPNYIRHFVNMDQVHSTEQDQRLAVFGTGNEKLYVGESHTVGTQYFDHADRVTLDGHILRGSDAIEQDTATKKYVDFAKLQKNVGYYSGQLAEMPNNGNVSTQYAQNDSYIRVNDSTGLAVVNTTASQLSALNGTDMKVYFPAGSSSGLLINIDMKGRSSFSMKHDDIYIGGTKVDLVEEIYNQNVNRVYWNFYDSSKADGNYTGSISIRENFVGTIIAPYASLESQGINGDIVVNNAKITGESHKVLHINNLPDPQPINTADFGIIKTYEGAELASMDASERNALLANTEFTVYKQDGTTVVAGPKSLSWNSGKQRAEVLFEDLNCGTSDDVYYFKIKETKSPAGYKKSDVIVDCKVERDKKTGLLTVYYKRSTQSNSAYSKDFPKFENIKKEEIDPQVSIDGWTYGEDANTPSVSGNPGNGAVTYTYERKNADGTYTPVDKPENAGEYRLTAVVAETDDYLGGTATTTFTIEKAPNTAEFNTTARVQRNRNGTNHTVDLSKHVENPAGTVSYTILGDAGGNKHDCTITKGGVFKPGSWYDRDENNPIYVRVDVAGDENHLPTSEVIAVTVTRGFTFDTYVFMDDWTYGEEPSEPELGPNASGGRVTVVYKKATDGDDKYNGTKPTEPGDYVVRYTIGPTFYYESVSVTNTFTIHKAEPTLTVSQEGWTYGDDSVPTPAVTATGVNPRDRIETEAPLYKKAGASDDTYTTTVPTEAGDYVVCVATKEDNRYVSVSKTAEFTIAKAENGLNVTVPNEGVTRGQTLDLSDNFENADGAVTYQIVDEDFGCTISEDGTLTTANKAGTITVKVTAAGDKNHEPKTEYITVVVNDKKPIDLSVTQEGWTYGDDPVPTPVISGNDGNGDVTIEYRLVDDDYDAFTTDVPTEAGEYIVRVTVKETDEYNGGTVQTTFTVEKAEITPAVTIDGWTYDETADTPELASGSNPGDGEVTYTYEKKNASGVYEPVEEPKDAGEYRVTATVAETDNYKQGTASAEFTIEKAENRATVTPAANVIRDGKTVDLSENVKNADGKVTYTIVGDDNGCTVDPDTGKLISGKDTGSVTVKVTIAGDDNHKSTEAEITVLIQPKNAVTLQLSDPSKTYDGEAVEPEVTGVPDGADVTITYFKVNDNGTTTKLTEAPKDAGNYIAYAEFAETDDYESSNAEKEFTIDRAAVTVTAKDDSKDYGIADPDEFAVKIDGLVGDDDESCIEYTVTRAEGEKVGSYVLTPSGDAVQGNYDVTYKTGTFKINATKDPAEISTAGKDDTVTVNTLPDDDHSINLNDFVEGAEGKVTFAIDPEGTTATGAIIDKDGNLIPGDTEGEVAIIVTVADSENHTGKTETIIVKVVPKDTITVTVDMDGCTYGEPLPTPKVSGPADDDTVTVEYKKAGENDDNYTTEKPTDAGDYIVRVTVAETEDHQKAVATDEFTIARAKATVKAEDLSKDYGAADPLYTAEVTGVKDGDTVAYTINREEGEDVGKYTLTPSGDTIQGNYEVTYESGTLTVKAVNDPAVVTTEASVKKEHTLDLTTLVKDAEGKVTFEIVSEEDETGSSLNKNVLTAGNTDGTCVVKVTIEDSKNHIGRTEYITVTVTPKDTFVPEVTMEGWTYGDAANQPSLGDTNVSKGDVTYRYKPVGADDSQYTTEPPTEAGDYVVCATVAETLEYSSATATTTFTIARREVTVTAKDGSKDYGADNPASYEATVEGLADGEDESLISYTVSRESGEDAGRYAITPSGNTEQGNYTVKYVAGTFTINPTKDPATISTDGKDNEVTVNTLPDDDHSIDLDEFVEGAEGNVTYTIDPDGTTATGAIIDDEGNLIPGNTPGEVKVIVTIEHSKNHTGKSEPITIKVVPKDELTVTAAMDDCTYGEDFPKPQLTGVSDTDTLVIEYKRVEDGEDSYSTDTRPDAAGEYEVRVTVKETADHEEAVVTAKFTVKRAKATVTAQDDSKDYGENDPAKFEATVTGLVNGDAESVITYTVDRAAGEDAGTYAITPSGDATQGNYDVTYVAGKFTIETIDNPSKISTEGKETEVVVNTLPDDDHKINLSEYVEDPTGNVTYDIIPDGTTATDATIDEDGNLVPGSKPGEVKVKIVDDGGQNYKPESEIITITVVPKAVCEAKVSAESFTYNGKAADATVTGVTEDDVVKIEYKQKGASDDTYSETAPKDAGDYVVRATVAENASHKAGTTTANFTIERAKATVTAKDDSKAFGDEDPTLTAEVSGIVEGDSKGVISYTVTRESGENAGSYAITPAGDAIQGNYDVTYVPAEFTITKANDPAVVDVNGGVVKVNENPEDENKIDLNDLVEGAEGKVTFEIDPEGTTAIGTTIDKDGNLIPGDTPGEVKVKVTIADSENHEGKTEIITITVTEKETGTLPVTQKDATYGDTLSKPEYTAPEKTGKTTVTYSGTLTDGTVCEVPAGKMPTEAGTYIVTVICETADAIYVGKDEFVIAKAVPDIGTVTADEVENDPDITKANVRYAKTDVPGKLILTETTLTEGTNTYHWTFVPEDTNNYEIVKGTVEIKMTVPAENPPVEGEMDTPDPTTSEETTEKKSDASDEKAEHESPKTGDENILLFWVIILAAATVYLVVRKRRQEAEWNGNPV